MLIGAAGLAVVMSVVCSMGSTGSESSSAAMPTIDPTTVLKASQPSATPPSTPELEVDAVSLWKAYDANEVSADQTYRGKWLRVSGRVESIDKDFMDNIVLQLAGPRDFATVGATLKDSEKGTAAQLTKGQAVAVLCLGHGRLVGDPSLTDCVLR